MTQRLRVRLGVGRPDEASRVRAEMHRYCVIDRSADPIEVEPHTELVTASGLPPDGPS